MTVPSRIRRRRALRLTNQAIPFLLLGGLMVWFFFKGSVVP